ncbi:hypothetical protein [Roseateles sp.]|uniref:hypothetical protein n=1 Tax=Roseateles sp. TaxID=1971397 RepID=UPI003BAD427B
MTLTRANKLLASPAAQKFSELGVPGLVVIGRWQARRFVIADFAPATAPLTKTAFDLEAATLTFPFSIAADAFVRDFRSFGARVERRQRDADDRFESVGDFAGIAHTVHAHHHIALCGARGPWPQGAAISMQCPTCSMRAATQPKHKARYHPLA